MLKNYLTFCTLFLIVAVNAQNYKFGKVSEEEVEATAHSENKDANAAILFQYQRTFYDYIPNTGFQLVTEYHKRIKIYTKDGFNWATESIPLYRSNSDAEKISSVKGVTYNMEGGKLVEDKLDRKDVLTENLNRFRDMTKFTMPNVTEGSVVEFEYKVYSPFIMNIPAIQYQNIIPVDKIEAKFTAPEFFIFNKYSNPKSNTYANIKESKETYPQLDRQFLANEFLVEMENIPALKLEPHVDNLQNYMGVVKFELQMTKFPDQPYENYSKSWEGVAKTIYDEGGMGDQVKRSGFFKDEVDAVIAGKSDALQKAAAIYTLVQQKMLWNDYIGFYTDKGTKNAYKEQTGNVADINLLLVAMLKYAGIDADPVLVSTPANGIPLFPTGDGFNYVIGSINYKGHRILLDATDKTAGFGELPKRARNWQGRLIKEGGISSWVNLYPKAKAGIANFMNLQFDENFKLKGRIKKSMDGLYAKKFRVEHGSKTDADLKEFVLNENDGLECSELKIENFRAIGNEITEQYDFVSNSGFEVIADKLYLNPLLFEAMTENPFKADERTHPIIFDFPSHVENTVNIMVPEGYEIVSIPESVKIKLHEDSGEFSYVFQASGNFIRLHSELDFNQTVYNPTDYKYLKEFYNTIVEKQNESIVLGKIAQDGTIESAEGSR